MSLEPSKSQVDRLGERLREGSPTREDLQALELYKHSFGSAYELVLEKLRQRALSVKGRPEKSTLSIVAKLRREKMRLSRMQDITGCRVIVNDIIEQNSLAEELKRDFSKAVFKDRRVATSHGYRAVHIIVKVLGRPVEIQLRTSLQQLWAEISERASDSVDPTIKYGGGPPFWRSYLLELSRLVAECEDEECQINETRLNKSKTYNEFRTASVELLKRNPPELVRRTINQRLEKNAEVLKAMEENMEALRTRIRSQTSEMLAFVIKSLDKLKEGEK